MTKISHLLVCSALSLVALVALSAEAVEACASCREGGVRSKACAAENRVDGLDLDWGAANANTFKKIAKAKQAVLLFFADGKNLKPSRTDVGDLGKKGLIRAIKIEKSDAKQTSTDQNPVPSSLFESKDLWQAYGVTSGGVYILTDEHGNEVGRSTKPKIRSMAIGGAKKIRARRKSVGEKSKAAKKALEAKELANAYVQIKAAFQFNLVGYSESKSLATIYADWLKAGRSEIKKAASDEKKLAPLRLAFKETPLEKELPAKAAKAKVGEAKAAKKETTTTTAGLENGK